MGFYISGHPLDKYTREITLFSNLDWNNPQTYAENREIRTVAIISQVKNHFDRKGNIMAFITLEDRHNSFEGVVFSSVYEKYSSYINKGDTVFVRGRVSESGEHSFKILCDEIIPVSEIHNRLSRGLQLIINTPEVSEKEIEKLHEIIKRHPGTVPLYFEMRPNGNGANFVFRSRKYQVMVSEEFLAELRKLLGDNNIVIKN